MPRDYSLPYIMDITQVNLKLEGNAPGAPMGPITPPKLKEIIREFVRLEGHCDDAKALCAYNVGQIINDGTVIPYPAIDVPVN